MKKLVRSISAFCGVLLASGATAQTFTYNASINVIESNPSSARIGLGVTPAAGSNRKLTVDGDIHLYRSNDADAREITAGTQTGTLHLLSNTNPSDGSVIQLCPTNIIASSYPKLIQPPHDLTTFWLYAPDCVSKTDCNAGFFIEEYRASLCKL